MGQSQESDFLVFSLLSLFPLLSSLASHCVWPPLPSPVLTFCFLLPILVFPQCKNHCRYAAILFLTFQITAGWRWEAFLRFTPHQFQAYLQHFHLLSHPCFWKTFKTDAPQKRPLYMCPAEEQKKVEKRDYFSSLMCIRLLQIRSLCLSSRQKKRMVKSKPTFSSEQLHVFHLPSWFWLVPLT